MKIITTPDGLILTAIAGNPDMGAEIITAQGKAWRNRGLQLHVVPDVPAGMTHYDGESFRQEESRTPTPAQKEWLTTVVKARAAEFVERIAPPWRQRNSILLAAELAEKRLAGETISQAELDARAADRAVWTRIRAVQAASNQIEADISGLTGGHLAWFDIENSPRWPGRA